MRWFGESWGAPICSTAKSAPTPDVLCAHGCGHDIRPGDIGLLLPYVGLVGKDGMPESMITMMDDAPHVAYHLVLLLRRYRSAGQDAQLAVSDRAPERT